MAKPKITLYVDIVSPFGYMGYYMLRTAPIFKSVDITYIPILLGGLMKACDNRTPLEIRNKAKWINRERLHWARHFDIPMSQGVPEGFPMPTLHLQRTLTALNRSRPDLLPTALDALYAAFWTEPNESSLPDPKTFSRVLSEVLPAEVVTEAMEKMGSDAVKKELVRRSNEAFEDGAFGLPWFQCTDREGTTEGFWGVDHLGQVVKFLGLEGMLDPRGEVRAVL